MELKEWYTINKKRFDSISIPYNCDKQTFINKVINVSFEMYEDLNYHIITDVRYMPSISLSDEDLGKWYYYIINMAKQNIEFKLKLNNDIEKPKRRRLSS